MVVPVGAKRPWTREQVEHLLATERFEYQRIELPHGLATPGRDRTSTARLIFPDRLDGKTVIDFGCNQGFFCFEAAKRGAARVVGIDADPQFVQNGRLLADCLGLDVTFEARDIERHPLDEPFDYVLSLNLLHHLRNPLAALDRFVEHTRERLVLEVATIGRHDRPKLGLSYLAARSLAALPVIFVAKDDPRAHKQVQKFFFTPSAMENRLGHHSGAFARVRVVPSEHKGGRFICLADKRRVGHLLVVAGPTAAGKRTFLRGLREGRWPEVAARLGLDPRTGWDDALLAERIGEPEEPHRERLAFVYDFLRPDLHRPKVNLRDVALDVLGTAAAVTMVTLWTTPERLRRQLDAVRTGTATRRMHKRLELVARDYADAEQVRAHYRAWSAFAAEQPGTHVVVAVDEASARVLSADDWERYVAGGVRPEYPARELA